MDKTSDGEVTEDMKQQAARWLVELDISEITPDLWNSFENWLSLNSAHRTAYLRIERAWHIMGVLLSQTEGIRNGPSSGGRDGS